MIKKFIDRFIEKKRTSKRPFLQATRKITKQWSRPLSPFSTIPTTTKALIRSASTKLTTATTKEL